jgi:hypothetical protein
MTLIVHVTCNIVTIKFKGREGGLKNPVNLADRLNLSTMFV